MARTRDGSRSGRKAQIALAVVAGLLAGISLLSCGKESGESPEPSSTQSQFVTELAKEKYPRTVHPTARPFSGGTSRAIESTRAISCRRWRCL